MTPQDETSRAILFFLYEGRTLDDIFALHPQLTMFDISRACGEGLRALEEEARIAPVGTTVEVRVETRAERIARVRLVHPRAFEPWNEEEDARLALRWREGATVAELCRTLGRPRGALSMRLEKLLGASWRQRAGVPRHQDLPSKPSDDRRL